MRPDIRKGAWIKMTGHDGLFEEILRHGPSAGSLVLLLTKMKEEGRLNEVVQACLRFLPLYPDDVRLRTLLAQSYAGMGFFTLAGMELEKVTAMIDDMASAYRSLADIYEKQKRHSEAADMARCYLAHHPGQLDTLEFLRRMETALLPAESLSAIQGPGEEADLSEEASEDALVDFATPTIAELYYSQGQTDAAIHTYEKVVRSNPDDNESLGRLNELRGLADRSSVMEDKGEDAALGRKETMISILERWLPKILEIKYA